MTAAGWVSLGAAIVATWPLALHLTSRVPLGTEHEATIPAFSLWNLWWTADRLPHAFTGFLDAPFFHPNEGVTAYSEPMPFLGALVSPLWAAGAPPPLIYNAALLAVLTLNGVFAYRVARALAAPPVPALLGAALAVALPFTGNLVGVLPNLALFGMLWTLDGLIRFGQSGWAGWAVWAGAGFVATYFSFQQYALFFAPVALIAGIVALDRRRFRRGAVARLAVVALLSLQLVLLLAWPTARIHRDSGGFERPPEVVEALSARPGDFLTRPATATVPFPARDPDDTAGLFPGLLLLGIALAGAGAGLRDPAQRPWVALLAGTAIFGILLALGLNLELAGWRPFGTLRAAVPGWEAVRSPYRAAAIFQLCLPVLAALALARAPGWLIGNARASGGVPDQAGGHPRPRPRLVALVRARVVSGAVSGTSSGSAGIADQPSRRMSRAGGALVAAVGLLAVAENLALPAPLVELPDSSRTAWTSWLREHPERTVLAHVPFPSGLTVSDYEVESRRLLAQIDHRRPIVNGYSGFFPVARAPDGSVYPAYTRFQLAMAQEFPSGDLLCVLTKSLGADTLVVDRAWSPERRAQLSAFGDFLRPEYADEAVLIYALAAPPGGCREG